MCTDMLSFCFWLLVEGNQVPASPGSLASVIGSVGLKDVDLREDGSELAVKLISLLTGDWILRLSRLHNYYTTCGAFNILFSFDEKPISSH